jgi:hypothetical protein
VVVDRAAFASNDDPGQIILDRRELASSVMAGLVPAIHVLQYF